MRQGGGFHADWRWWLRTGERMLLGLDVERVLRPTQDDPKGMRAGLERVSIGLRDGLAVAPALRRAGLALPVEAWCLLETCEHTGRLGEGMKGVGEFLRARELQRRELLGQIWYPLLVLLTGAGVMGLILLWVVPQLRAISSAMGRGARLPWLTEQIGALYGGLFLAGAGVCATVGLVTWIFHYMAMRSVAWGRVAERVQGRYPCYGRLRAVLREARLLRQIGTLLRGGTTLPRALEMAAAGTPNLWERQELLDLRRRLLMGAGLAAAIQPCPLFSRDNHALLIAGQESGQLEIHMERIAADLREQAGWRLRQWTRLLEPLFLLALSSAVGGLILAYLLPMVTLLEQVGGGF